MNYNTMKKAELVTMLTDKDGQIATLETEAIVFRRENEKLMKQVEELDTALKIAKEANSRFEELIKNALSTAATAIQNAEDCHAVAENAQKIAADAIDNAKKSQQIATNAIERTAAPSVNEIRARIDREAYDYANSTYAKTGKWLSKSQWKKKYNAKKAELEKAAGLA